MKTIWFFKRGKFEMTVNQKKNSLADLVEVR